MTLTMLVPHGGTVVALERLLWRPEKVTMAIVVLLVGALARVLEKLMSILDCANNAGFFLECVTDEPLALYLHGRPNQCSYSTRLGQKPCQAPAWLTIFKFGIIHLPLRHH